MAKKSWPILNSDLLYKLGHYFLNSRYDKSIDSREIEIIESDSQIETLS